MDSELQQIAGRVKESNNILVTVSRDPSVDQLAACMGLTLALNKLGKHATAVFSGAVPSTIEFLQPEKTLEKNTDSLRDFIISLDRSKADKLRYKLEDQVVKIFITPYKTSIGQKDLEFRQGDFNVDVVLALGVHEQEDLDQAIVSHGRILHDATVATLNVSPGGQLGSINCLDTTASSLSEMITRLIDILDKKIVDNQIATALLTGIVAETARFSNEKTTPKTMAVSSELMAAGANQQLVASKLEEPQDIDVASVAKAIVDGEDPTFSEVDAPEPAKKPDDGTLEINHDDAPDNALEDLLTSDLLEGEEDVANTQENAELPEAPEPEKPWQEAPQIHIDEQGQLNSLLDEAAEKNTGPEPIISHHSESPKMVLTPPTLGGQLTANSAPEALETSGGDPLTLPAVDSAFLGGDSASTTPTANVYQQEAVVPDVQTPQPATDDAGITSPDAVGDKLGITPSVDVISPTATDVNPPAMPFAPQPQTVASQPVYMEPSQQPVQTDNAPTPEPPVEPIVKTEQETKAQDVESARNAVELAMASMAPSAKRPDPIAALNAQPAIQVNHPDSMHGSDQMTDDSVPPVPPPIMPPAAS